MEVQAPAAAGPEVLAQLRRKTAECSLLTTENSLLTTKNSLLTTENRRLRNEVERLRSAAANPDQCSICQGSVVQPAAVATYGFLASIRL